MELASYMTEQKISDEALAAEVGCHRAQISRIRRGVAAPSLALAARIAKFTNGAVTPNDFAGLALRMEQAQ